MEAFVRDRAMRLVENFGALGKVFKFQTLTQKRLAAFYFAEQDRPIPVEEVVRQEKAIKTGVGRMSSFRGLALVPLSARLVLEEQPQLFARTESIYRRLRETLSFSDHLVLASLELALHAEESNLDRAVTRMLDLHAQLKRLHRFRIGPSELALLSHLALTDESVENLIAQIGLTYEALRTEFSGSAPLMALSLYLVVCEAPSEGLLKVVELSRKFSEYGHRMKGRNYAPVLGILSNSGKGPHTLVGETMGLFEALKKQKGFSGWHAQRHEVLLHASALVALENLPAHLAGHQRAYVSAAATAIAVASSQSSA